MYSITHLNFYDYTQFKHVNFLWTDGILLQVQTFWKFSPHTFSCEAIFQNIWYSVGFFQWTTEVKSCAHVWVY